MKIRVRYLILLTLVTLTMFYPSVTAFAAEEEKGTPVSEGETKGTLTANDVQMKTGEYYDLYEFKGKKNEKLTITLTSADFDTYLIIIAPTGQQFDSDDINNGADGKPKNLNSQLEFTFADDGFLKIGVSSAKKHVTGEYKLIILVTKIQPTQTSPNVVVDREDPPGGEYLPEMLRFPKGEELKETTTTGRLRSSDDIYATNRSIDWYYINVTRGDYLFVTVTSKDFDAFLVVVTPEGYVFENDDINRGVNANASISRHLMVSGACRIGVTSSFAKEKGKYQIRYKLEKITLPEKCPQLGCGMIRGKLDAGSARLSNERLLTWYTIDITEPVDIFLQVTSAYFDTLVFVVSPTGQRFENDDVKRGENTNSRLETNLRELGVYFVGVTTCRSGESGMFSLIYDTNVKKGSVITEPEIKTLKPGKIDATLTIRDNLYMNKRAHFYEFEAKAGTYIDLTLTSDDFETLMLLKSPTEKEISSDAYSTNLNTSKIQLRLMEAGNYLLVVTSESEGNIGRYELLFSVKTDAEDYQTLEVGENKGQLTVEDEKYLGKYIKWYQFKVEKNFVATFTCASSQLDPYIILITPDGLQYENDDAENGNTNSRISVKIKESGTCILGVSSFRFEKIGRYCIRLEKDKFEFPFLDIGKIDGELTSTDLQSADGRLADYFVFKGKKGYTAQITMKTKGLDPKIKIISPSKVESVRDDSNLADKSEVRHAIELGEDGDYTVVATTGSGMQVGAYSLNLMLGGFEIGKITEEPTKGALNAQSLKTRNGSYVNWYTLNGMNNRWAALSLESTKIDSYLIMITPEGERIENNNSSPGTFDAAIRHKFTDGKYLVGVTSFNVDEVGEYQINLTLEEINENFAESVRIKMNEEINGKLVNGDRRNDDGRLFDEYLLTVAAGKFIQFNLDSDDFDPQIYILAPDNRRVRNDDISQGNRNSQILLKCDFAGDLRIMVLPNRMSERGKYKLTTKLIDKVPTGKNYITLKGRSSTSAKYYGIFVGISDYPANLNDLKYCREDAIKLATTFEQLKLMNNQNYTLLTDKQATIKNLKQAFDLLSTKITKDDIFVFFYSGHGIQGPEDAKEKDEVDRRQEYLYLYDGKLQDDTLNGYFSKIKADLTVITIDCCFAGGFARDLISEPKRVGFFSSEEDLTSAVAQKFKAGGFLSFFFRKAIEGDGDNDNTLTIGELSHYLHIGYGKNVSSQYAITSEGEKSYQHLVVDRGGVRVSTPFVYR